MNIDKYKIVVQDEYNLRLTVEVPKGRKPNGEEVKEGETSDKFIGYYGSLSGALKKIANIEIKGLVDANTLGEVLNELQALEARLDLKYGSKIEKNPIVGEEL